MLPLAAEEISPITAALIGAIGAVVGGGLTAGASVLAESRRQRHAADDRRERDDRAMRQAARLVLAELGEAEASLAHAADSGWLWDDDAVSTAAWHEGRHVLASGVDDPTWDPVERAYLRLASIDRVAREHVRTSGGARAEVLPRHDLAGALEAVRKARSALTSMLEALSSRLSTG